MLTESLLPGSGACKFALQLIAEGGRRFHFAVKGQFEVGSGRALTQMARCSRSWTPGGGLPPQQGH